MSQKIIYYFGNPYLEEDNLAVKVVESLKAEFKQIKFIHIESTFQLLDLNLDDSLLFDVADVPKPMLINSKSIIPPKMSTTHDFDLGFFLKLENKSAKIFVIPKNYPLNSAIIETRKFLQSHQTNLLSKSE
jgi:hypothetical protein